MPELEAAEIQQVNGQTVTWPDDRILFIAKNKPVFSHVGTTPVYYKAKGIHLQGRDAVTAVSALVRDTDDLPWISVEGKN